MQQIQLYNSPLKEIRMLFLTIPLMAIGIWMIAASPVGTTNYIVGWVCTCFFGLSVPIAFSHLIKRKPQITISEAGITCRNNPDTFIPWEQINNVSLRTVFAQDFISLNLHEPSATNTHGFWQKLGIHTGAKQRIDLHINDLGFNTRKLTNFLQEIASTQSTNRWQLIQKYFQELQK
jgi:hypothetical protein